MITSEVIKEIYKKFSKPCKTQEELMLPYYIDMLSEHHVIRYKEGSHGDDGEIIVEDLEEYNPFRRFLVRSLHGVIEFDSYIAFIFKRHILFFGREDDSLQVHIKPEEKQSLFSRLFGGDDE